MENKIIIDKNLSSDKQVLTLLLNMNISSNQGNLMLKILINEVKGSHQENIDALNILCQRKDILNFIDEDVLKILKQKNDLDMINIISKIYK